MRDFHSLRTSWGTKRAVAPYWAKYRRGKKKALECPYHDICLKFFSKRTVYAECCPHCLNREGAPRAYLRDRFGDFDSKVKRMEPYLAKTWLDDDAKFQKLKAEIDRKKIT